MARPKSPDTKQEKQSTQPLASRIEKTKTTKPVNYVVDLKVNSPASLGYLNIDGLDSAPAIVRLSKVKGLDVIAITDLYSGEFIDALVAAAQGSRLTVIPGVSLRCKVAACDDVIISCLFPETTTSADVASFLQRLEVPPAAKGSSQFIVPIPLDQILHVLESFNGVAIPTRVDKTPHRLAVLGELVDTYGFRAFDLAYTDSAELFRKRWPRTPFRLFSFSDAYALAQIGSRTERVKLHSPGFAGIKQIVARQAISQSTAR